VQGVLPGPHWQFSPYSVILGLTAVLALAIAGVMWRRRPRPGAVPFALLLLAVAEWAGMAALEHAAVGQATKVTCARLEYAGIMSVAPLWLTFALAYTGRGEGPARRRLAALVVIPLATVGLVWTNEWHRLVWTTITASSDARGAPLVYGHGVGFWTAAAYNHALLLAGTLVLVSAIVRFHQRYRRQMTGLIAGLLIPWIANALYLSGWSPLPGVDPTPLAFTLTGVVYALSVFRHGLLDLVPVARHVLIESMADGVLVLDVENRVIDINPSARAMIGVADAPVVGESAEKVLGACPDLVARYRDVSDAQAELRIETAEGPRCLDLRISPLRDAAGRFRGRLLVVSDITIRKRTEEALRQSEKLTSLGQLLAGVAHELNNPLSVIVGHAALLRRHLATGPAMDRVEKIATAAERCDRIVANFLAVARQRVPERRATDLNRVLRDAVDLLAYQLNVDNVAIAFELAADLPPVWADRQQIHQVVVNLLVNAQHAMRATEGPRRLTLTSRYDRQRRRASFSVADTGPGVPVALRHRIFEPFFTTKPVDMGTGLGLSISRGIVEAHQGSIEVESPPGGGATFVVELPLSGQGQVAERREPGATAETIRGKRILVVDDEPMVAEILIEILAEDGHRVEVAPNGTVALEKLEAQRFDLIISDVKMPILDGQGLYRALALHDPGLRQRFVFLTGDTLSAETREFIEMTGAPTLDKPFDAEVVRRVVQEALRAAGHPRSPLPPPSSL
jgi:PAS domain S-box-containing protein